MKQQILWVVELADDGELVADFYRHSRAEARLVANQWKSIGFSARIVKYIREA